MTNRQLRRALLEKLEITHQALSQRCQNLKRQCAMTTEDAIYVIAQREGIILSDYLDNETVDRIRGLMQQISPRTSAPVAQGQFAKGRSKRTTSIEKTIVIGQDLKVNDPILPNKTIIEATEMAKVYPLLYILENSIRELIKRMMAAKHSEEWWDTQAPQGLRETVRKRMQEEQRNSWHQRRSAHPIDYLDLNQLPVLMRKVEKDVVPDIIPSLDWFTQFVDEVYKSRCVVCHMNPLDRDNIQAIKLRFKQWQKQIQAKKALISGSS